MCEKKLCSISLLPLRSFAVSFVHQMIFYQFSKRKAWGRNLDLVVKFKETMIITKPHASNILQCHRSFGSGEEYFDGFFNYRGGHFGHETNY